MATDVLAKLRQATKKQTKRHGPKCKVCRLSQEHPKVLEAIHALRDEGEQMSAIARGVEEAFGIRVSGPCVAWHFKNRHTAKGESE